jgi:heptosyltransferase-2
MKEATRAVRRILVRVPNWIGDAVMCTPALDALRELFPSAEVTVLARSVIADVLKGHAAVDRCLVYDFRGRHAGLTGKWSLAGELRRLHFDLAVLFQNAFEAALLAYLGGVPRRLGYATDGRSFLLSDAVTVPGKGVHQIVYYGNLLRGLGHGGPLGPPRLFLAEDEERRMAGRLAEAGIDEGDLVVGVNPGSTYGGAKRWLPERFGSVADRLVTRYGAGRPVRVLIVGAPGEEALGRAVASGMQAPAVEWSGRTTVRELMAVVKRCGIFVTNDTGPMHIAAAFGVPVVAVFGPTDASTTGPFGTAHTIIREPVDCSPCLLRECPIDHRCMTRVPVEAVYVAAARTLGMPDEGRGAKDSPQSPLSAPHSARRLTVFLDRDGTINKDTGYIKTPDELELLPGVVEAVARLNRAGARVVVVTNQSGIARGYLTGSALEAIHRKMLALFQAGGAWLDAIYYCPHHPDDACRCRKPGTGMVERAVQDLGLDLTASYVVGDQTRDLELARRVGARSVLMRYDDAELPHDAAADHVAAGWSDAVDWILADAAQDGPVFARTGVGRP